MTALLLRSTWNNFSRAAERLADGRRRRFELARQLSRALERARIAERQVRQDSLRLADAFTANAVLVVENERLREQLAAARAATTCPSCTAERPAPEIVRQFFRRP